MAQTDISKRFLSAKNFVWFTAVSFVMLLAFIAYNNCVIEKRQQRIVDIYEQQANARDSLLSNSIKEWTRQVEEQERKILQMVSDSTIESIPYLCNQQRAAVKKFIVPCWEESVKELKATEKVQGNIETMDYGLKDEISALLSLEFTKIQNEYESLEIWAALLTIVFLIFSFYSLFKTEELEQRSREALRKIEELTDKGNSLIASFESRQEEKFILFNSEVSTWKQFQDANIKKSVADYLDTLKEENASSLSESRSISEKETKEWLMDLSKNLSDEVRAEMDKVIKDKSDELFVLIEDFKSKTKNSINSVQFETKKIESEFEEEFEEENETEEDPNESEKE